MARLKITTPDGHSRDHALAPGRTVIGRGADCTLVIDHPTLSRQHAAVEQADGAWIITDLGSRNGVRLEGRPIVRANLKPGDHFRCGKAEFVFSGEASPTHPSDLPTHIGPPVKFLEFSGEEGLNGPEASARREDEITTEIEVPGKRRAIYIAMGALGGLAAAALVLAFVLSDGGGTRPVNVASKPAETPAPPAPAPTPKDDAAVVQPAKPPEEAATALPDPEKPREGEVRVRFRDGTARVGKVVKRTKFDLEIECVENGKTLHETYGLEEVLRIGTEPVRPDWSAIFNAKVAKAKTDDELKALEAWCRKYGYDAGRQVVLEMLAAGKQDMAVAVAPEKAKTVRYGGRDWDPKELRAEGKLDARGRFVLSSEDLHYLRDVHFDLLGRSPTDDDLQRAAAETRGETVDRLLDSVECFETWYEEEVYYFLLLDNFRPATERLLSIPKKLSAGSMTLPDAIHEIVISQYFNHRNPGNDTYVTVIFEQLLGMVVQEQPGLLKLGKEMYDGYERKVFGETGRSQSDLVSIVMKQKKFYEGVLARLHKRVTGEAIPANVLANNVDRVMSDPKAFHGVIKEWLLNDDYITRTMQLRKKSDHQFIRGLYTDLLGRRATYDEFRLFRNALQALADPTPIRSVLAKVMVDSDQVKTGKVADPAQWTNDLYVRMLGRYPTAAELEAFVKPVKDGKPKLAIQAIVDSEEYQNY